MFATNFRNLDFPLDRHHVVDRDAAARVARGSARGIVLDDARVVRLGPPPHGGQQGDPAGPQVPGRDAGTPVKVHGQELRRGGEDSVRPAVEVPVADMGVVRLGARRPRGGICHVLGRDEMVERGHAHMHDVDASEEIGRASCRERVL